MTQMRQMIKLFRERFIQRDDCYPVQCSGETGSYKVVRKKLTDSIIVSHLRGNRTIGLYCSSDSTTKWLCIDIDSLEECEVRESQNHARRFNIPYLTEFSGKKGYHLWVFFDKPYTNRIARALASAFAFDNEVFPKQDSIPAGKLGNLVKAPMGIHQVTGRRCLFLDRNLKPEKDQFNVLATIQRINPIRILKNDMPELWSKLRTSANPSHIIDSDDIPIIKDCVRKAIMTGTTQGHRNRTAHIIASELRNSGILQPQAETLLALIWNKRNKPPLEQEEIETIINSAYGKLKYKYGCGPKSPIRELLRCVGISNCLFATTHRVVRGGVRSPDRHSESHKMNP